MKKQRTKSITMNAAKRKFNHLEGNQLRIKLNQTLKIRKDKVYSSVTSPKNNERVPESGANLLIEKNDSSAIDKVNPFKKPKQKRVTIENVSDEDFQGGSQKQNLQ